MADFVKKMTVNSGVVTACTSGQLVAGTNIVIQDNVPDASHITISATAPNSVSELLVTGGAQTEMQVSYDGVSKLTLYASLASHPNQWCEIVIDAGTTLGSTPSVSINGSSNGVAVAPNIFLNGVQGASGTFKSGDTTPKTITVTDGFITGIA